MRRTGEKLTATFLIYTSAPLCHFHSLFSFQQLVCCRFENWETTRWECKWNSSSSYAFPLFLFLHTINGSFSRDGWAIRYIFNWICSILFCFFAFYLAFTFSSFSASLVLLPRFLQSIFYLALDKPKNFYILKGRGRYKREEIDDIGYHYSVLD